MIPLALELIINGNWCHLKETFDLYGLGGLIVYLFYWNKISVI
jgi:hypothetical protein